MGFAALYPSYGLIRLRNRVRRPGNIQTHHNCARPINAANMSRGCRNLDAFGRPSVMRVWGHGMVVFGPNLL